MADENEKIESCDECECHDEEPCYDGSGNDNDAQLKYYRDNAFSGTAFQITANSVIPGLKANPYRTSCIFTNIGTTILLIRSHPSNLDPVVAGPTVINRVLYPNRSWEPDCKCYRKMIQGNICVVNTDLSSTGAISIGEQLSKPDTEPTITGGRYAQL